MASWEDYSSPIRNPLTRYEDLNENSTRFDMRVASLSDNERRKQWLLFVLILSPILIFMLIIFTSILVNKKVRRFSFNLYLVFLMIPDIIFTFFCTINCVLNLVKGDYYSTGWCHFQSFYSVFGISANSWLNAMIARELHKMLQFSYRRQRYFPPLRKTVRLQSIGVYAWCIFLASWPFIPYLPHRNGLFSGIACLPVEYNRESSIFYYAAFLPLFILIPVGYVGYVTIDVLRRGLLPRSGKARVLSVYFFRLISVFFLMWLPSFIVLLIAGGFIPPWLTWAAAAWGHVQGAVSAVVSYMKPDIRGAVMDFVTCRVFSSDYDHESNDDRRLSCHVSGGVRHNRAARRRSSTATQLSSIYADSSVVVEIEMKKKQAVQEEGEAAADHDVDNGERPDDEERPTPLVDDIAKCDDEDECVDCSEKPVAIEQVVESSHTEEDSMSESRRELDESNQQTFGRLES